MPELAGLPNSFPRRLSAPVLLAVVAAGLVGLAGWQLVRVASGLTETRTTLLPAVLTQHQQAIWAEALRGEAGALIDSPDAEARRAVQERVRRLADGLRSLSDGVPRRNLENATAALEDVGRQTERAASLSAALAACIDKADAVIADLTNAFGSIVEDTSRQVHRLVENVLANPDDDLGRGELTRAMNANTTSQDLYASLERGRHLLASTASAERAADLEVAKAQFGSIAERLLARVGALRGNTDYEFLPDLIDEFAGLAEAFDLRAALLETREAAHAAQRAAEQQLAVLRESLSAGAAEALLARELRLERQTRAAIQSLVLAVGAILLGFVLLRRLRGARSAPDQVVRLPQADATETVRLLTRLARTVDTLRSQRIGLAGRLAAGARSGSARDGTADPAALPDTLDQALIDSLAEILDATATGIAQTDMATTQERLGRSNASLDALAEEVGLAILAASRSDSGLAATEVLALPVPFDPTALSAGSAGRTPT